MSADTITEQKLNLDVELEKTYSLILHNDDTTPFDLVIYILVEVFYKSVEEALEIAMAVHTEGKRKVLQGKKNHLEKKKDDALKIAAEYNYRDFTITVEEDD